MFPLFRRLPERKVLDTIRNIYKQEPDKNKKCLSVCSFEIMSGVVVVVVV